MVLLVPLCLMKPVSHQPVRRFLRVFYSFFFFFWTDTIWETGLGHISLPPIALCANHHPLKRRCLTTAQKRSKTTADSHARKNAPKQKKVATWENNVVFSVHSTKASKRASLYHLLSLPSSEPPAGWVAPPPPNRGGGGGGPHTPSGEEEKGKN